jgi:hypothetical protein
MRTHSIHHLESDSTAYHFISSGKKALDLRKEKSKKILLGALLL